jgi:hypothetical protein
MLWNRGKRRIRTALLVTGLTLGLTIGSLSTAVAPAEAHWVYRCHHEWYHHHWVRRCHRVWVNCHHHYHHY